MDRISHLVLATCLSGMALCVRAEIVHFEAIRDLATTRAGHAGKTDPAAPIDLQFMAFGRIFRLQLEPNTRLGSLRRSLALAPSIGAYRGKLQGQSDSWVRIVTTDQGPAGLIWDGQALYGLEVPFDSATSGGDPVIFRLDDVHIAPGSLQCGAAGAVKKATELMDVLVTEQALVAAQQGASYELTLGAIADYEFTQSFGADAEAALLARFNNVDGIFSEQLGIQITVAETALFTAEPDPFTATAASELLDELAIFRGNSAQQDALGLTHLFTGRNLDGSTAGIAYVGTLCATQSRFDPLGRSFGVGLSEGVRGLVVDSLIAAHEIGHNFGAPHDAESGSACEATDAAYLMAPTINGSDEFSPCSVAQMQLEISGATCLTPIGQADPAIEAGQPPLEVSVGQGFEYALIIRNTGVEPAIATAVSVALGSALELDAAWSHPGCELVNTDLSCSLGDLAGGAELGLTLALMGSQAGSAPLVAQVNAQSDADPSNNMLVDTIILQPMVNLALAGSGTSIPVGQERRLSARLTNTSNATATAIEIFISASAGLRVDAASLGGSACEISLRSASCRHAALAAGALAELEITLTGLTAGSQNIELNATSAEADADSADNTLRLGVDVSAQSTAGTDAGGGGASLLLLLLLAPAAGWRAARICRLRSGCAGMAGTGRRPGCG